MKSNIFCRRYLSVLALSVIFLSFSAFAQGTLVINGGFEGDHSNGPFGWGWTSTVGIAAGYPGAAEGQNWADVYGTIYQDIPTVPGQAYHLQFAVAGDPNNSGNAQLDALWGTGNSLGAVVWNPAGHNMNNLGWVYGNFDMVATAPVTRITFSNPFVGTPTVGRLDSVSITPVPEPGSLTFLCMGVLLWGGYYLSRKLNFKPALIPIRRRSSKDLADKR